MWPIDFPLSLLAYAAFCLGHLALWVMTINRLHATGWPRPFIKALDKLIYALVLLLPAAGLYLLLKTRPGAFVLELPHAARFAIFAYAALCAGAGLSAVFGWVQRRSSRRHAARLISNHTTVFDVAAGLGHRPVQGWLAPLAARLPANEILSLHVNSKALRVPTLPAELNGFSIAHVSDIHMCGRLTQPFFDYVVDRTNELEADLVCITGDIVEKTVCLPWLAPTLGRLRSRHGVFFVLGNHDKRLPDPQEARRLLVESGLIDLGGRCVVEEMRGAKVLLAGNELPWFGPAPSVPDFYDLPLSERAPFRILLSHTPDQIYWAMLRGFELMLAGHCHGGQICLPVVGPLVSPSFFGVKYAAGLFHESPTLMHVSRGVSGLEPLRFNCPPELTKLVLARE